MTSPGRPRALVLGDDLGVFLAVARSLGRRGIEVHLVPAEDDQPGLASRYVAACHTLPAYRADAAAWVEALRRLIAEHGFRLVIPCSDSDLLLLGAHADALGRDRLALPNREAAAAFTDKAATRALASRLRVPVADGELVEAGSGWAERLGLPLVLKPRRSYRLGGVALKERARIVRVSDELERALSDVAAGEWLAERFFEGEGVGLSVVARDGEILLAAQHRRLQTLSETGGSSVRRTEATDPRLLADVATLAREVALTGPAMFEFRQNRAGAHVLIEVNARFWGSLPLAVAAGADFPGAAWDVFTGAPLDVRTPYRTGLTRTHLTGEFERRTTRLENAARPLARAAAAASLVALLAGLWPPRFDSWAADDPAPFRCERRQVLKRLFQAARKRLSPGREALRPRAT